MENLLTDKVGIIMVFSLQNLQQFLYSSTIQAFTHKSNDIILVQIFYIMYIIAIIGLLQS